MKNRSHAVPWWGWLAWAMVTGLGLAILPHLPARVPIHYNFTGSPDRFGPRLHAVLMLPAIILGILLLWQVLWRIDPKKRNGGESFWPTYRYVGGLVVVLMAVLDVGMLVEDFHHGGAFATLPVRWEFSAIGLFILLLSNVLPRLRPNWWIGIRTPWTLSNERSWVLTHRLAGHVGVAAGLLMIAMAWTLPIAQIGWAVIIPIALWGLVAVVASYCYAR